MDSEYQIDWADGVDHDEHGHQIICESHADDLIEENNDIEEDEEYLVGEEIIPSTEIITISNSLDQIAAENLIYMAQDGSVANMGDLIEEQVDQVDNADYNEQQYFECHVTEEVITDDWVQQQGEDRVEVPVYQLVGNEQNEEILVPLPTDEYTTSRPYPCDFCSRRFRKKANLMNHMVAHKNVKPHICNLCGARYIRKMELMNHLKVHAQRPDSNMDYMDHMKDDVKSADELEGDDDVDEESLLTVLHTAEPSAKQRKIVTTVTSRPSRRVVRVVESGRKQVAQQRKRRNDSAETSTNYILADHMPALDPNRPFVCQVCGVSFSREKALNAHITLHGVENAFECDTCNDAFLSAESLEEHEKIHANEESSGSEYEPDGDKTASDEDFDPKYGNYYCNVCGMSFHRPELLKRHTATHKNYNDTNQNDSSSENHCCNVCGSAFAEALDLLAHAEIHTRASIQKCTLCGESFAHDNEIRQHIITVHDKELTITTCRMCGKHCKDERTLMKHAWEHSKEKNHNCSECGKTFYNKARLKRHMQSHRNKSVTCNVCGESFPDGRTLMNHRHSHTNLSGRQFPCRECGKTFGSRSSQQIHMRIHTGERPYGCRFCWKAFADGGTLRKHERIHTGEKPYACPVCPRAFNQRVVLREHIRSHHSQPDPNYEDSLMPFYCTVCGSLFKSSQEIIQHLIEHSDANTVSNRQPVVGPRKYKRRRKLKPEELESFRTMKLSKDETTSSKSLPKRTSRKRDVSEQSDAYYSSSYEQQEEVQYDESGQNDAELENIEVDEPETVQKIHSVGRRIKQESVEDHGPIYIAGDYVETTPSRKTLTKRQSKTQSNVATPSSSYSPSTQRQARFIHTSKTKVVVETKGGRQATKTKTIVTSNVVDNSATRRSSRAKQPTNKKTESMPSPARTLTNGTPRSAKSQVAASANSKFQSNLLAELSKKNSSFSPDVVSDLEEILGSPIKTREIRTPIKSEQSNAKSGGMLRVNYSTHVDDGTKPATRSSKRLSNRVQTVTGPVIKQPKSRSRKSTSFNANLSSEESQESQESQDSQDEVYENLQIANHAPDNIVMNIKQEKEVSYIMTDDNSLFTCEICSAVFSDRPQLLAHVPVHI